MVKKIKTQFVTSPDNQTIAYDVQGDGLTLILLHGGNHDKSSWHTLGYVADLESKFKVITIDIRGNGESDKPTSPLDYEVSKICEDILRVADICNVDKFIVIGFSFGGNIGKYLASQSERVIKVIILGISFGPGLYGDFANKIHELLNKWKPIIRARDEGTLDINTLDEKDKQTVEKDELAWFGILEAMLSWKTIIPSDLICPCVMIVGSKNEEALTEFEKYYDSMTEYNVEFNLVEGLNHEEEFTRKDIILPLILSYL